jgi:hypothetical protein
MKNFEWRKSTRSGSNGGACVEIRIVSADDKESPTIDLSGCPRLDTGRSRGTLTSGQAARGTWLPAGASPYCLTTLFSSTW